MALSGEKPELIPATLHWSEKEKNERSEWFLIAGFIAAVGLGIIGIGVYGLFFWISRGPDKLIDIFVCTMAIVLGVFFLTVTLIGILWLKRQRPAVLPPADAAKI